MATKVIPVLRIFDVTKAMEFYKDWLGFQVDWEHRFEDNSPLYMQVSKGDILLHLTEHHGDCCPGAKVFIETSGLKDYHQILMDKNYKYNKPGLEEAPWDAITMQVHDPFGNRLLFSESTTH
ncbi:glyoxalase superfamily protein [Chitinophaga sp.]|uniref:glyoxalase superfamily protein n=1 Tax=Chitinophaga sp. TaxID=1869181 RepID=UPI0025BFE81C|nr:glyoxalase superfamily protein [Chitinophaga sp.]